SFFARELIWKSCLFTSPPLLAQPARIMTDKMAVTNAGKLLLPEITSTSTMEEGPRTGTA
ncbi:MAG TPA: hypothetical protein PK036_16570, partial [Geobacteraceae bacterium]|nr:hypothetical protein [Geobacteraceae bacterium]